MQFVNGMIGIDVSKNTLEYALRDGNTHAVLWQRTVPNTPAGIKRILSQTPSATPWVVEPTGRYSLPLVKQAQESNQDVRLAPPRKAKLFLASLPVRGKTDKLDSRGLALFGLTRAVSQPLAPYPVKSDKVEQLDQLLSARRGISQSLSRLKQQQAELPHAAEELAGAVVDLQHRLTKLDKQIAALTTREGSFPIAAELDRIPGIGPVIAAAVAARLEAKAFAHPDQFVAYIGMDLVADDSGERKGCRRLSKQGDAELRRLLYLAAQASLRSKDSPFKEQYNRELGKGLKTTAAICAVARKLARVCWSLHRHKNRYDPRRVYEAPASTRPKEGADR